MGVTSRIPYYFGDTILVFLLWWATALAWVQGAAKESLQLADESLAA